MIGWIRSRLGNDEGFTLVELMVVVLIIAILVAIAIPTFLGARTSAQDRAAQSNLRNALTAEKVYYVDNEEYTDVAADLAAIEPSIDWAAEITVTYVPATDTQEVCLSIDSSSGKTFFLRDVASGVVSPAGTFYGVDVTCATTLATTADAGW